MKTVLITGASSGIGRALCIEYAKSGYKVFAGGRNRERLELLSQSYNNVVPLVCDLTDLEIDGVIVTSTPAELNILDGVTATTAELNLVAGVTATTAELNYVDGVTSSIQTQLGTKLATGGTIATATITTLTSTTANITTVDLGNWTLTEAAGVLKFATGGVDKAKLDASGNFTVVGEITAYGTI